MYIVLGPFVVLLVCTTTLFRIVLTRWVRGRVGLGGWRAVEGVGARRVGQGLRPRRRRQCRHRGAPRRTASTLLRPAHTRHHCYHTSDHSPRLLRLFIIQCSIKEMPVMDSHLICVYKTSNLKEGEGKKNIKKKNKLDHILFTFNKIWFKLWYYTRIRVKSF